MGSFYLPTIKNKPMNATANASRISLPMTRADYAPQDKSHLIAECHDLHRRTGWWSDIHTGQPKDRNRGELLALVHTELSEAHEAWVARAADDKLPHRDGCEVELADAFIRLADYAIGFGYPVSPEAMVPARIGTDDGVWIGLHNSIARVA